VDWVAIALLVQLGLALALKTLSFLCVPLRLTLSKSLLAH